MTRPKNTSKWTNLPFDELLDLRLCDLGLQIEGTFVEKCVDRLHHELAQKGMRIRPHVWLSDEWFCPEGVPGIAVPFYLAHRRLIALERKMMLEVEGGTTADCMRILRHEAGHAVQHAYQVQRRRRWQKLFGRSSSPYPEYYRPNPLNKRFVQHLDGWYAQSHPDEDFAETFAVWLSPRSAWRSRYQNWPALKKLEYVEELIGEIGSTPRVTTSRARVGNVSGLKLTLREHYDKKRIKYAAEYPETYDRDLQRLFTSGEGTRGRETAAAFLRRHRREVRDLVCEWTGEYAFTVDQVVKEMMLRSRELGLRVDRPTSRLKMDMAVLLTVHTMQVLYRGPGWHPL